MGTSQANKCGCGKCRNCYFQRWRRQRRVTGAPKLAPHVQERFDWEKVTRAWCGTPVGEEKLTRAERDYLADKYVKMHPDWTATALARVLCMEPAEAAAVASDVLSGRVVVPRRDWQGEALYG